MVSMRISSLISITNSGNEVNKYRSLKDNDPMKHFVLNLFTAVSSLSSNDRIVINDVS